MDQTGCSRPAAGLTPNTKYQIHDEIDFLRFHQSSIFNPGMSGARSDT